MGIPDEGGEYTSIDVDALGQAVDDLAATLTGLTDKITGLESDFGYFGVDKTNFNKLMEAKSDLESIMPDMRRRHSLAVQLLAEQQTNGWAGDGVLIVEGTDILNDDFGSVEEAQGAGSDLATQVNNATARFRRRSTSSSSSTATTPTSPRPSSTASARPLARCCWPTPTSSPTAVAARTPTTARSWRWPRSSPRPASASPTTPSSSGA